MDACNRCVNHPISIFFINLIRWIPVVFIVAVIVWSYYAYVFELCFFTINSIVEKTIYLIFYHVILILLLWAYYQTIFSVIGKPPASFYLPSEYVSRMEAVTNPTEFKTVMAEFSQSRQLPIQMRAYDGAIRYCDKCKAVKPDRCHHCSVCGQCVLKFDHHCPWVNTCVNYRNYKFFIQFLGYALLYCLYVFLTDLQYFVWFWKEGIEEGAGKFHIMFMFFVSGMFSISVTTLFVYHLWLSAKNRSTIESFRDPVFTYGPDKNGFNLGWRRNYQEVFGSRAIYAFIPVFTALGNGYAYPLRSDGNIGRGGGVESSQDMHGDEMLNQNGVNGVTSPSSGGGTRGANGRAEQFRKSNGGGPESDLSGPHRQEMMMNGHGGHHLPPISSNNSSPSSTPLANGR